MEKAEETAAVEVGGLVENVDRQSSTKRTHKKPKPVHRWSSSVARRVKALKKLEYEAIKQLRVNYYVELHALDMKYQELFAPLDQQRCDIINGDVQPSDSDCQWSTDESDTESSKSPSKPTSASEALESDGNEQKGIPDFWLNLLENRTFLPEQIQEHDRAVLKVLKNIRIVYLPNSYRLEFIFGENDYFTNAVLSKEYEMDFAASTISGKKLHYYGPTTVACTGCNIDWKPGKDVTKIPQNDGSAGYKDSFFNFFARTGTLDPNAAEDDASSSLEGEFEFARSMRQDVLPRAASVYANQYFMEHVNIVDDDDSYVEEEDEDYYPHTCTCNVRAASSHADNDDD